MIKDKLVEVIIDSGAATSVISNGLRKKLEIPIGKSSKVSLVLPDNKKVASLGKVEIMAEVFDKRISIIAEVIDSPKEDFLIGNNTLQKYEGNIDYGNKITTLIVEGEEIVMPVEYELLDESEEEFENKNENEEYEIGEEIELYWMNRNIENTKDNSQMDEANEEEIEEAKTTVLAN